jgi:hypothetical protein
MTKIQVRRGTQAAGANSWSNGTVLASGEIGFETDTGKFKIGDGNTVWSSLQYFVSGSAFNTSNSITLGTNIAATTGTSPWNGSAAITIDLPASLTGVNASTATTLATSRNINGSAFNGSANVIVGGAIYGQAATSSANFRNIYVSATASPPTAPVNGDVWISF